MIDQFGRAIDYMRLSVTDRCNLRCQYCTSAWFTVATPSGIQYWQRRLHRSVTDRRI